MGLYSMAALGLLVLIQAAAVMAQPPFLYAPTQSAMGPLGTNMEKAERVARQVMAKQTARKSFDDIAAALGTTNVYAANLIYGQAQLKPAMATMLKALLPSLNGPDLAEMQKAPWHSFDTNILQEPALYRLYEAITHNGLALKSLINEKFGDGIMSAIDFYFTVDKMVGKKLEDRVVVTMNGKFLPYIVQNAADDVAARNVNATSMYADECAV